MIESYRVLSERIYRLSQNDFNKMRSHFVLDRVLRVWLVNFV